MRRRVVVAALSGLAAFTAAAVGSAAPPVGAQEAISTAITGNFVGGPEDEMFIYDSIGEDGLVAFSNGGAPGGPLTNEVHPFPVNGYYYPVAGDFDGDGYDEIFWYAPGTARDYRWDFVSTTQVTSTPETVSGADYWPQAGDFLGDGADDLFWYGPGTVGDSLWDYNPGGGRTIVPQQVGGDYWPVVGSFGSDATDDLFWYAPGTARDSLWDFHPNGSRGNIAYTVNGAAYFPFALDIFNQGAGGGDLFWYLPGTGTDYIWDYQGGVRSQRVQNVNGDYFPVAGDYFGDGCSDIAWFGINGLSIWDWPCTPGATTPYVYPFPPAPAAARSAASGTASEPGPSTAAVEAVPEGVAAGPLP